MPIASNLLAWLQNSNEQLADLNSTSVYQVQEKAPGVRGQAPRPPGADHSGRKDEAENLHMKKEHNPNTVFPNTFLQLGKEN